MRVGADRTIAVLCHACGFRGDVLHLVAAVEGLDVTRQFGEVLRRAAELAHVDHDRPHVARQARTPPASTESLPLADDRFAAVVGPLLYMGQLEDGGTARDVSRYLADRGLLDAARAEGWAALPPPDLQPACVRLLLEAAEPGEGYSPPFTREEVFRAGLLVGRGLAHSQARLLIPWRDPAGRVANLQRRRIDRGEPRYVGPRGRPYAWPYGVERLGAAPMDAPIAIVEGATDVLALRELLAARGETAIVLGVPGLAGWRAVWGGLARGRIAAVAIDADAAGERYVMQIARDCATAGARGVERWDSPGSKDWADALRGTP